MPTAKIDDEEYDPDRLSAQGNAQLLLLRSVDADLKRAYAHIAVLKIARANYAEDSDSKPLSVDSLAQLLLLHSVDAELKRVRAHIAVLQAARDTYVEALRDAVTPKRALN